MIWTVSGYFMGYYGGWNHDPAELAERRGEYSEYIPG